jgi:hypothetical protein
VKPDQFHRTELLDGGASVLVLALSGRIGPKDDEGLRRSFAAKMVSVSEVRREHDVEGINP